MIFFLRPVSYPGSPGWSWFCSVIYSFGPTTSGQVESTIFGFSSSCFKKSAAFISLTGEASLVSTCFHIWGSPISTSLARLFTVGGPEFKGKRGVGKGAMAGEMPSLVAPTLGILLYGKWIWANYPETSCELSTTTNNCMIVFLAHTNTVNLLEHIFFLLALRFWSN